MYHQRPGALMAITVRWQTSEGWPEKARRGGARSVTDVDESHPSRVPVSKPDEGRLLLLPADCTSGVTATTAQSDCYTYETRPPLERIPFQLTEVREVVEPMSVPPVCVCTLSRLSSLPALCQLSRQHVSSRAHCLGGIGRMALRCH
jgi:hypothetical protein